LASEGGALALLWILKISAKKVALISRGRKQISPLLAPSPGKILEKSHIVPPWKKSF